MSYITKIETAIKKHGSSIQLYTKGQSIQLGDPNYDYSNPDNNKGAAVITDLKALIVDNDTQALQALASDLIGKQAVTFMFYSALDINRTDNKIKFNNKVYGLVDIKKTIYKDELLVYRIIGAN